jgi:excinuclease UvrABC ATPase subunit
VNQGTALTGVGSVAVVLDERSSGLHTRDHRTFHVRAIESN